MNQSFLVIYIYIQKTFVSKFFSSIFNCSFTKTPSCTVKGTYEPIISGTLYIYIYLFIYLFVYIYRKHFFTLSLIVSLQKHLLYNLSNKLIYHESSIHTILFQALETKRLALSRLTISQRGNGSGGGSWDVSTGSPTISKTAARVSSSAR